MNLLRVTFTGLTALVLGIASIASAAAADAVPVIQPSQKPAWLAELSLGIKESYDDNVFLAGADAKYLPPTYTVPAGSVAALKDCASWVTTVSPKVALNFNPLLGDQKTVQVLSLAYAPDLVGYHDQTSENYAAHRVMSAIKGKTGAFSFSADNTFAYINGNNAGPTYPGGLLSAYAMAATRERREQIQDKAAVTFQYDWQDFFVRPTAALTYYELMTELMNVPGYQNFADRYDVNGGADLGGKLSSHLALTLGYRYGHQYQQQYAFTPYSSSSDYQRVLFGIEGKPWSWLDVKIQGGPDFRDYMGNTATHITPVSDPHLVTYYGEAWLTATVTTNDLITFKYKQWQWLASTGKVPYFDSTFDLSYHRKLTDKLGFDLGGKILSSDYTSGNLATCHRNDWDYGVATGLGYAVNRHLSVNLAYSLNLGRNAVAGVPNESTREFNQNLVSLGALLKF